MHTPSRYPRTRARTALLRVLLLPALLIFLVGCTEPIERPGSPAPSTSQLIGTVINGDGSPRREATVDLYSPNESGSPIRQATTITDSEGHYAFTELTPAEYSVVAMQAGDVGIASSVSVAAGQASEASIQLAPGATIEGTVILASAESNAAINRRPSAADGVLVSIPHTGPSTTLQPNGSFSLGPVPISLAEIVIGGAGYAERTITDFALEPGGIASAPPVTLRPPGVANLPPVADLALTPDAGPAPLSVTLDASSSYDPDGIILAYEWLLGDIVVSRNEHHTLKLEQPGEHVLTLRVTDNDNETATSAARVRVTPSRSPDPQQPDVPDEPPGPEEPDDPSGDTEDPNSPPAPTDPPVPNPDPDPSPDPDPNPNPDPNPHPDPDPPGNGGSEDPGNTDPPGSYPIEIRYVGSFSEKQKERIDAAAAKWSTVITTTLTPTSLADRPPLCKAFEPGATGSTTGVIIHVVMESFGNPYVLGAAGPCALRGDTLLPFYGLVRLNSFHFASESSQLLYDTMLHEIGHVLGIGTLWGQRFHNLLDYAPQPSGKECNEVSNFTSPPRFTGPNAKREYGRLFGNGPTPVPVEYTMGPGSDCGHWLEEEFDNELMTGLLNTPVRMSRVTIGSLQDLGYEVDYEAAEKYNLPVRGASLHEAAPGYTDILLFPVFEGSD